MITKRLNEVETKAKTFCGNCEQEARECTICGKTFEEEDYIKCVCLQDMVEGKEYLEFIHLCSNCKHKKHNIEK
jgi:hypothetical protein